jgi:hypothetical protein
MKQLSYCCDSLHNFQPEAEGTVAILYFGDEIPWAKRTPHQCRGNNLNTVARKAQLIIRFHDIALLHTRLQ